MGEVRLAMVGERGERLEVRWAAHELEESRVFRARASVMEARRLAVIACFVATRLLIGFFASVSA